MQRLQAYKYELIPDGQQKRSMSRFAGSCRFVYNKALALQKEYYESQGKKHSYSALCKLLTQWRASFETPWLCDSPSQALQQSIKDLERAYDNFFAKRADFPRFKRKGVRDSFRYPQPQQIKLDEPNSRLFLPKLGWMRYCNSRNIQGQVRNATVSLRAGKWFVSIQTEREVDQPLPEATSAIGIDVGIAAEKRDSAAIGGKPNARFSACTPASATPATTTYTKPQPLSAKTTRWCVLRICRYAICRNRQQGQAKRWGATSKPNQG